MGLEKPLLLWINDGLMAIFFLVVALELKGELIDGALSNWKQISLPLAAAIGGIALPALIYVLFNSGDSAALRGWAIPAATDIAFALGVLAMLGDKVPKSLKTFLLSVAVFDDLGAILIIAAFYTESVSGMALSAGLIAAALLFLLNRLGVTRVAPYFLIGIVLWFCVLKSGVHATLAGVIVGLAIPYSRPNANGLSPAKETEHALHPWVAFMIVPIFAFANSGVSLSGIAEALFSPIALGIIAGLFFGKMIGVFGISALLIRSGWAEMPKDANWPALFGVCIFAGVGFTMSLFIGTLAFENTSEDYHTPIRVGVLVASLLSAVVGYLCMSLSQGKVMKTQES